MLKRLILEQTMLLSDILVPYRSEKFCNRRIVFSRQDITVPKHPVLLESPDQHDRKRNEGLTKWAGNQASQVIDSVIKNIKFLRFLLCKTCLGLMVAMLFGLSHFPFYLRLKEYLQHLHTAALLLNSSLLWQVNSWSHLQVLALLLQQFAN